MPNRGYTASQSYRYGFNGKENDNEVKGAGNEQDFEARVFDPRVARFLSLDPNREKYPGESPFMFGGNNPLLFADRNGKDKTIITTIIDKDGKQTQIRSVDKNFFVYYHDNALSGMGYYMKADVVQNLVIDLRKDGKDMFSQTYEVQNRKETSFYEFAKSSVKEQLEAISGYTKEGIREYGFRIIGDNPGSNWESGLPSAKTSDILDLRDWLSFAGGLREGETATDLWQKTINYFRMKGVKISSDAKQVEEAALIISNMSSNIIEAANKTIEAKESTEKGKKADEVVLPAGSDSCRNCHQVTAKGTLTHSEDVTPTKAPHKVKKQ